jgi:hypothetical protein
MRIDWTISDVFKARYVRVALNAYLQIACLEEVRYSSKIFVATRELICTKAERTITPTASRFPVHKACIQYFAQRESLRLSRLSVPSRGSRVCTTRLLASTVKLSTAPLPPHSHDYAQQLEAIGLQRDMHRDLLSADHSRVDRLANELQFHSPLPHTQLSYQSIIITVETQTP